MADQLCACTDCDAEGKTRLWPKRSLRQGRCQNHYNKAKAAGLLPRKRRPDGSPAPECSVHDCHLPVKANDLCASHNARRWRGGDVGTPLRGPRPAECSFDGCDKPVYRGDLCAGHNSQLIRGRTIEQLTPLRQYKPRGGTCAVDDCGRDVYTDELCISHYERKRVGEQDWDRPIKPKAQNGEGTLTAEGYRVIYVDGRKVMEHRYVMELVRGRPLLPTETVHHKTGGFEGRSDNRPENLELWTTRHPRGHRIEDVVAYAREMLAVYGGPGERAAYAHLAAVVVEDQGEVA